MSKGKFIVFEGIDGCGKSSQIQTLAEYLKSQNIPFVITKEPTEDVIGSLIRQIQRGGYVRNPSPKTMMYLYAADRTEHVRWIHEQLKRGKWVLCDRYLFSSLAYQGENIELRDEAININCEFPLPDLTIWLDISPEESYKRITDRGEVVEIFEKLDILKRTERNYRDVFISFFGKSLESSNFCRINADQSKEKVHEDIITAVQEYLKV